MSFILQDSVHFLHLDTFLLPDRLVHMLLRDHRKSQCSVLKALHQIPEVTFNANNTTFFKPNIFMPNVICFHIFRMNRNVTIYLAPYPSIYHSLKIPSKFNSLLVQNNHQFSYCTFQEMYGDGAVKRHFQSIFVRIAF